MELEDLDNINKNDFLPLLPLNIKQELLDNNVGAVGGSGATADGVGGIAGMGGSEAGGGSEPAGNNLCDSVQKQVCVMDVFLIDLVYIVCKHAPVHLVFTRTTVCSQLKVAIRAPRSRQSIEYECRC